MTPTKLCSTCKRPLDARQIKSFDAFLPEGVRVAVFEKTLPVFICPVCDSPGPTSAPPPQPR